MTNVSVTQVLEFDVAMYMNGIGMFFGEHSAITWEEGNGMS